MISYAPHPCWNLSHNTSIANNGHHCNLTNVVIFTWYFRKQWKWLNAKAAFFTEITSQTSFPSIIFWIEAELFNVKVTRTRMQMSKTYSYLILSVISSVRIIWSIFGIIETEDILYNSSSIDFYFLFWLTKSFSEVKKRQKLNNIFWTIFNEIFILSQLFGSNGSVTFHQFLIEHF